MRRLEIEESSQHTTINMAQSPSLVWFFAVYYALGAALVLNYVWGAMRLNGEFPNGNSVNADQTGATNLWGKIFEEVLDYRTYC